MRTWGEGGAYDFPLSFRLDDVESKLAGTEREAEKARKDSKSARDQFNDVKKRRYACRCLLLMVHRCSL